MSIRPHLTKALLLSLLIPFVLGDLGRIHVSGPIYINSADFVVFFVLCVAASITKPWSHAFTKKYLPWLVLISATFFLSLLLRFNQIPTADLISASLYPARFTLYFLLPIVLVPLLKTQDNQKFLTRTLILSFVIVSLAGILQLIFFPNLQFLELIGYDPHYLRIVSTWLDPNFLGAGFVFITIFTLAQKTDTKDTLSTPEKYIFLSLFALTIMLTFSRSAYIFAALAMLIYALFTRSAKLLLTLILIAVATYTLYAFPRAQIESTRNIDRGFSANMRLKSYLQAITLFQENPLTGVGYNLMRYERKNHQMILDNVEGGNSGAGADSSWLLMLATTGILGILVFLSFWIRLAYFVINPITKHPSKLFTWIPHYLTRATPLQHAVLAIFLAWSIHAWFINSLFYVPLMLLWQILFSLVIAQQIDNNQSK